MSETKAEIIDTSLKDSMENFVAQLGTEQDKRSHSVFVNNKRLSAQGHEAELEAMYRTDWLSGKVVDIVPDDMTREWRSFTGDIEPDVVTQLVEEEKRLDLTGAFNLAHKWSRLYGTSFIIMNVDDGNTPDIPLDFKNIKEGSLRHIKVLDRTQLSHRDVVPTTDVMDANFGFPKFYTVNESSQKIHFSRVVRFDAVRLPYRVFQRNNYYSDSILDRMYEAITNFNTVSQAAASMVYETNVDIMKVKNLMQYLQTAEGTDLLTKRMTLANMQKSINNMLILDTEEEYDKKTNSFSGLPDLLDRYASAVTGASDIPATRLLGSSASGLNATGEGDLKNYYDMVKSQQKVKYKPKLDIFDNIMAKSLGLSEDTDLSYTFNPLFQMTPKEISDMNLVDAQRDEIYMNHDVVTEATVAKELKQNETYTNITDEHIKDLEEFENVEPADLIPNTRQEEEEEASESPSSESPEESGGEIS